MIENKFNSFSNNNITLAEWLSSGYSSEEIHTLFVNMDKAMKYIKTIVEDFEEGKIYEGKVVSIKEFGAFVEFAPGKEGMVHISKISNERINHVEDVLTLGDHVKCKCMGKDKMGRISFSIKDAI